MGLEWLKGIVAILTAAGIRAGEGFPSGRQPELTGPVAAVGLRDLNCREGTAEFEIRILSPRTLGGWQCQNTAAEAAAALEDGGVECRLEPMTYRAGGDCFEMVVVGRQRVMEQEELPEAALFSVTIGGEMVEGVTEFSAEQDRGRRLIGTLNQTDPVGITRGTGGWSLRMVQIIPSGGSLMITPEEPFELKVHESGVVTSFQGCCWNRMAKILDQDRMKMVWEGFALTRTEALVG